MTKDIGTRLFMSAFEKYVRENEIEITEENMNEVLQEFIVMYNNDRAKIMAGEIEKSDEEKIADLLDEASMCNNPKSAKKLVDKALEINPDHIGALLFSIDLMPNPVQKLEPLLELKENEKQRLAYYQKEMGDEIDNFYLNIEGRDYLHILFDLCQTFMRCGMYRKALEVAEEAIELDEMDHGVFHNDIISLHLHLENFEDVEVWLKGYQVESPASLLFRSILAYKQYDLKLATTHIQKIYETYPEIIKIMTQDKISERVIEKMMYSDKRSYIEEFMDIIRSYEFLFSENAYFDWMTSTMKEVKKKRRVKKTETILN